MQAMPNLRNQFVAVTLAVVMAFSGSVATPQVAYAASKKVYVAPESGTKYHCKKECRGLKNANEIVRMSKKKAKEQGYKKCKICY